MRSVICGGLLVCVAWALAGCAVEKVVPKESIDPAFQTGGYEPLFGDEVVIENEAVTLAVSPRVGRIVWFGARGGRNLLWVDPRVADEGWDNERSTWVNYGGDKVWPTVQPLWDRFYPGGGKWPPEGVIDGQPWEVLESGKDRIVMQSRVSPDLGVRVRREIVLLGGRDSASSGFKPPIEGLAGSPVVRIENLLVKEADHPAPLTLWTVTQVRLPVAIDLDVERPVVGGKRWFVMEGDASKVSSVVSEPSGSGEVRWAVTPGVGGKIGTYGRGIAARYEDVVFAQRGGFRAHGPYADGSNVQAYVSGDYAELELLSPTVGMKKGEVYGQEVLWYLE